MKKKFLIIVFISMLFLMPIKVLGLTYSSSLSGNDTIFAKSDNNNSNMKARTSLYIDVSNLENISYLELYVSYDTNLVGISTCNSFNYIGGGCGITNDKKVYYIYKYNNGLSEYINKYHLYTVTFMYTNSTPTSGSTNVSVSFKNAKDKEGNSISISSSSKTYNFSEVYMKMSTTTTKTKNTSNSYSNNYTSTTKVKNITINTKDSSSQEPSNNEINNKEEKLESSKSNNTLNDNIKDEPKFKITKKMINIAIIIAGVTIIVFGTYLIISYKKNKKLDKMFDEFDKF